MRSDSKSMSGFVCVFEMNVRDNSSERKNKKKERKNNYNKNQYPSPS